MVDGEVRSVPALELGRYLGLWFEAGRLQVTFLSRDHRIPADVESSYLDTAREQGFDLEDWIRPRQSGRVAQV